MSSIIDALKKSDQNRSHNNQADINNIKFSDNPPKSRRGFWLLVIVLLLIAGGVFAWQQGWHQALMNLFGEQAATPETTQPMAKSSEVTKPAASQNKQSSTPATQTNKQLMPPKQSEIREKIELARIEKSDKGAPLTEAEDQTPTVSQVETTDSSIQPLKETPQKPLKKILTDNKPRQVAKQDDAKPKSDESADRIAKQNKTKQPADPVTEQDYLLLHQIDYAIRKDIPQIKINIHIYDPEPENRMVLINGERYNIGDTIEEVLTVSDIVKEGIVVSFASLKFLIPK